MIFIKLRERDQKDHNTIITVSLCLILLLAFYARFPAIPVPYLWHDEAWRADLIVAAPSPQAAVTYAAHERLFIQFSEWVFGWCGLFLLGQTTMAFRIWPLLFAMFGLIGIYLLVATISSRYAALLATLFIGIGAGFVQHAREFKPYALDLALTVWTLYAVASVSREQRKNTKIFLAILLHLFALFSLVFVFIFPAVLVARFRSLKFRWGRDLVFLFSSFSVFVVMYFCFLKPQQVWS